MIKNATLTTIAALLFAGGCGFGYLLKMHAFIETDVLEFNFRGDDFHGYQYPQVAYIETNKMLKERFPEYKCFVSPRDYNEYVILICNNGAEPGVDSTVMTKISNAISETMVPSKVDD